MGLFSESGKLIVVWGIVGGTLSSVVALATFIIPAEGYHALALESIDEVYFSEIEQSLEPRRSHHEIVYGKRKGDNVLASRPDVGSGAILTGISTSKGEVFRQISIRLCQCPATATMSIVCGGESKIFDGQEHSSLWQSRFWSNELSVFLSTIRAVDFRTCDVEVGTQL